MAKKHRKDVPITEPTLEAQIEALPLELDRIALRSFSYEEKEITDPPEPLPPGQKIGMKIDFQGAVGARDNLLELQLRLRVEPDARHMPFVITVVYSAYFIRDGATNDAAAHAFLHGPGVRILFPYIRETISTITSKGLFGVLFLDPMDIRMFTAQSAQ